MEYIESWLVDYVFGYSHCKNKNIIDYTELKRLYLHHLAEQIVSIQSGKRVFGGYTSLLINYTLVFEVCSCIKILPPPKKKMM